MSREYPFDDSEETTAQSQVDKRVFHTHHRFVTLVRALVVFVTFVVKEGVREHMKGVTDSIESSENVFLAQTGSSVQSIVIVDLAAKMSDNYQRLTVYTQPSVEKANTNYNLFADRFVHERLHLTWEAFERADAMIANASRLSGHLPERSKDIEDSVYYINSLKPALAASYEELSSYGDDDPRPRGVIFRDLVKQRFTQTVQLGANSVDLVEQAYRLCQDVLAEADKARDKAEANYKRWTWISYGLYSFGWGLAFMGTLYGVGSPSDD